MTEYYFRGSFIRAALSIPVTKPQWRASCTQLPRSVADAGRGRRRAAPAQALDALHSAAMRRLGEGAGPGGMAAH